MGLNPTALLCALDQDLEYIRVPYRLEHTAFAASQLRSKIFSKYEEIPKEDLKRADDAAIAKFLLVNERCAKWSPVEDTLFIGELVGHLRDELHSFFNPNNRHPLWTNTGQILDLAYSGPGSSVGANGKDFYTKFFSSNLTGTREGLYGMYRAHFGTHPLWAEAERFRIQSGFGFRCVSSSRTETVPKNVNISRSICVEPSLNTFFQLGLGQIIESRLKSRYGIDLSTQPDVNRELARIGALDGSLVTIDLESASDSMSTRMMSSVIDRYHYRSLYGYTCRETTLPDGRSVQLNMLSTMGNGFTFPLQTALFAAVVCAARRFLGKPRQQAGKSWSVFGDDIICDLTVVGCVLHLLRYLGFVINEHKSFLEGPFRESCGRDFFNGHDVRPVYIKTLLTAQARCTVINQLNRWSAMTSVPLHRTVSLLLKSVRFTPVPFWDNDDAGVKVPSSRVPGLPLHVDFQSTLYYRYNSEPKKLTFANGVVKAPKGKRKRIYNPSALFLSMLNGTLENGSISIRHDVVRYRRRWAVAPSWDHSSTGSDFASELERQRWRTAVEGNIR